MNVKLSKHLKFTVKGFETVSKGFSFLLEKFAQSSAAVVHNGADDSGTKVSKYLINILPLISCFKSGSKFYV